MTAAPMATMPVSAQMHHQHQHDKSNGENAIDRNTRQEETAEDDNER
jgi:hypothetical protein